MLDSIAKPTPVITPAGFKNERPMVACESGDDWTNLPYEVYIGEELYTKDNWNSIEGMAYFKPVKELVNR